MEPYRKPHQEKKRFYLGTNCHVLCIDQLTGQTVWQTKLQSNIGSRLVSLLLHKGQLYAACSHTVACLDAADGRELWSVKPRHLGEPVSLALALDGPEGMLLAGGGGVLYALAACTGEQLWKNGLPRLNYHPVTLRVPGALVAQPTTGFIPAGKTAIAAQLEDHQYEAEGFAEAAPPAAPAPPFPGADPLAAPGPVQGQQTAGAVEAAWFSSGEEPDEV